MKRIFKVLIILICIIIILMVSLYFINKKNKNEVITEYQPEEEISEEQERQTIVSLYFRNKTTKKIEPEARLIDVKELVKEPYKTLMDLLIEGPKKENLERTIPEDTVVNSMKLENDTLIIDFSKEFIEKSEVGKEAEMQVIESIVNTMTELTEINSIKILIDGEANKAFLDNEINFENVFSRED